MTLYTPVIRAKANDISAIDLLSQKAKQAIRPLVEPAMSLVGNEIITDCVSSAARIAGEIATTDYYFDPLGFESFDRHILAFRALQATNENFIPTIGFGRGRIDNRVLAQFLEESQFPLAVRLEVADLEDASEDTWVKLIRLTHALGINPKKLTLLLDFGDLSNKETSQLVEASVEFLSLQPKNFFGLDIVVLGGSALRSVAPSIPVDGKGSIERKELKIWANLQFELEGAHSLHFGDYGIMAPSFVFPSDGSANANAKIRYTHGSETHYFRGHALYKPNRFDQYHDLAQRVVNSEIYLRQEFSVGDLAILECAQRQRGPGNLGTWVKFDTNHHVEFVARQLQQIAPNLSLVSDYRELNALLTAEISA